MKFITLSLCTTILTFSSFVMAGGVDHKEDTIAKLKEQMAELSKRLDNLDKYTSITAKSQKRLAWAEKIKINGDFRYRYEQIDDHAKTDLVGKDKRNRSRIRARFGLTAKPVEDVMIGIALATGSDGGDPISSNTTLGGDNSDKGIVLDQGYITWDFADNLRLTAGKTKVKYFKPGKSSLIFDGDLRPEGAHLQYDSQDIFATLGYNLMDSDDGSSGNGEHMESWGVQAGYKFNLNKNTSGTAGLGYYSIPTKGREFVVDSSKSYGNTVGSTAGTYKYDYEIQQLFAEVITKISGVKTTLYADFVRNDDADEDIGYIAGIKAGSVKKRGDLAFGYAYQDLEADAVLGAHTDSDFGGSSTDSKGSKIQTTIGLSKKTNLSLTYLDNEYGGANNTSKNDYNRLQVDLNSKF